MNGDETTMEILTKPDSNGDTPDLTTLHARYVHARNRQTYIIIGWAWLGDTDVWCVLHKRQGSEITYSRPLRNFHGEIEPGIPRYMLEPCNGDSEA